MRTYSTLLLAIALQIGVPLSIVRASTKRLPPPTTQSSQDILLLVKQLGAPTDLDAQAAEINLSLLPPSAFPTIEAAAGDKDLNSKASTRLKRFIEQQGPWQTARARVEKEQSDALAWKHDAELAAYEKFGKKDPRWDADARKAIGLCTLQHDYAKDGEPALAVQKAMSDGCTDPLILYFDARRLEAEMHEKPEVILRHYVAASAAFDKSKYPASRKIVCYAYCAELMRKIEGARIGPGLYITGEPLARLNKLRTQVGLALASAFSEKMPALDKIDLASTVLSRFPSARKPMFDRIDKALEQIAPDDSTTLTIKGKFYITYAWAARGSGFANTVTPEGWEGFRDRLAIAGEALTKAWEKDHTNYIAAREMLTVELGQGLGRDQMELWFHRAMEANPDDSGACFAKLYYLEPKWHGSIEDMVAFGRECAATQNWRGNLPPILMDAHERAMGYSQGVPEYFSQPQVWSDVQSLYAPYLKAQPLDMHRHNVYCHFACLAKKWDIAAKEFEILGDKVDPAVFDGEETLHRFQVMASQLHSPSTP